MIQYFKVINPVTFQTDILELVSPEKSGFIIKNIEGLGPVKSVINTTEAFGRDGENFNSSRLSKRNIVLDLEFFISADFTAEMLRYKTYRIFTMNEPLLFEIQTGSRTGQIIGYVETNEVKIFSKEENTQISIICPDPLFYEDETIINTLSGIQDAFEFPFENNDTTHPITGFGEIYSNDFANAFYEGDAPTGLIIHCAFNGDVDGLILHNANNSESMYFNSTIIGSITGSGFTAGDILIVSTLKGNKFAMLYRGVDEYNVLNALMLNSTWLTLKQGDNIISYSCDSGYGNMDFYTEHKLVYEGL